MKGPYFKVMSEPENQQSELISTKSTPKKTRNIQPELCQKLFYGHQKCLQKLKLVPNRSEESRLDINMTVVFMISECKH